MARHVTAGENEMAERKFRRDDTAPARHPVGGSERRLATWVVSKGQVFV